MGCILASLLTEGHSGAGLPPKPGSFFVYKTLYSHPNSPESLSPHCAPTLSVGSCLVFDERASSRPGLGQQMSLGRTCPRQKTRLSLEGVGQVCPLSGTEKGEVGPMAPASPRLLFCKQMFIWASAGRTVPSPPGTLWLRSNRPVGMGRVVC